MKDKLIKQIVYINLFAAILIYIPIFIPFSVYIAAYGFMFRLAVIHLMVLMVMIYGIKLVRTEFQGR